MKTRQASIIGLLTMILIAGAAAVDEARADLRVRATLRTPRVHVRVSNVPDRHHRYIVRDHRYRGDIHSLSRRDHLVAKRIARVTGIPRRELLELRSYGYGWRGIGRWYDIPRPLIRAAQADNRTWKRWLKRGRPGTYRIREVCRFEYDD
jgi:hypothetical protein